VNGAFGNGHLVIAVLGALALAFVAWQRWQVAASRIGVAARPAFRATTRTAARSR
jgi:hypothetical protein